MQLIETPKAKETREYRMLVGGAWVDALSSKTFESVNPYTGKVWATAPEAGEEDVDRAVRAAREAFDEGPWGKMTGTESTPDPSPGRVDRRECREPRSH